MIPFAFATETIYLQETRVLSSASGPVPVQCQCAPAVPVPVPVQCQWASVPAVGGLEYQVCIWVKHTGTPSSSVGQTLLGFGRLAWTGVVLQPWTLHCITFGGYIYLLYN